MIARLNPAATQPLGTRMLRVLTMLAAACVTSPALAQRDSLVVLLRDPSVKPVNGANAQLTCRPASRMQALGAVPPLARGMAMPPGRTLVATSDARGELRFPTADAPGVLAGSGLATNAGGLGALIVDLQPGRPQRLLLQPMAGVVSARRGEEFTLYVRALLPAGRTVVLPPMRGETVLLPEGVYEAWAHGERGWIWQRLHLVSTRKEELHFDGPAQQLRSHGNYVHPDGRPEVDLLGGRAETTLRGGALAAPLVAWTANAVVGPQVLPGPVSDVPTTWPRRDDDVPPTTLGPVPTGAPLATMRLFGVVQNASGDWQVRACCTPSDGADGKHFVLPPAPPGDAWLLFVADGHAPQARPWTAVLNRFPFALERGAPLRIAARDGNGTPVVDLEVEYVPADMLAATVSSHTDHRGEARLGQVLAPGVLRVSDPRFANDEIAIDGVPIDAVPVTVTDGELLRGRAVWPDGSAAPRVVVELRDPRGRLRPATRTAITADDGSFAFPGLPPGVDLVLFATALREHRTWSAKIDRVRGGTTEVLVLRDEDPQLRPPEKVEPPKDPPEPR